MIRIERPLGSPLQAQRQGLWIAGEGHGRVAPDLAGELIEQQNQRRAPGRLRVHLRLRLQDLETQVASRYPETALFWELYLDAYLVNTALHLVRPLQGY
jgi:hypothetical protein